MTCSMLTLSTVCWCHRVWLGGKEYAADPKTGEVVIPYRWVLSR